MGMSAFGLMILLCLLSVCILVKSASILEKSGDLWQNWLLHENEEVPSQQSSPLSRRITPKSVFIAPAFSRCSDGYRLDGMGNCVKIVRLTEAAQWELVLERLKIMSAQLGFDKRQSERNDNNNDDSVVEKPDHNKKPDTYAPSLDKDNTGPFQLSIPFNSNKTSSAENQFNVGVTSTEKTTERPILGTQSTPRITENPRQPSFPNDYTSTEEYTTMQDANTPSSGVDDDEFQFTESNHYITESVNTETATGTTVDLTTEDLPESTFNTASHFCPDCEDKAEDATETSTTPVVVRRVPNYSSILPLKSVGVVDKNVERVPTNHSDTKSKPASSYVDAKVDDKPTSTPVVHSTNSGSITYNVHNYSGDREDTEEDAIGDSSNLFQRLPSNERTKPKCDPFRYNCVLQFNILPTDKPLSPDNRRPPTAFVRFPETPTKSYIRFPAQKPYQKDDDVGSYSESNPAFGYWNRRYPTSWWTSWNKSKPQLIRIVPENNGMYAVGDVNYIRSHPHFQTHTEWYSNK